MVDKSTSSTGNLSKPQDFQPKISDFEIVKKVGRGAFG